MHELSPVRVARTWPVRRSRTTSRLYAHRKCVIRLRLLFASLVRYILYNLYIYNLYIDDCFYSHESGRQVLYTAYFYSVILIAETVQR